MRRKIDSGASGTRRRSGIVQHDALEQQLRDALRSFHDVPYLQSHPLIQVLGLAPSGRWTNLGIALQDWLKEAIGRLKPDYTHKVSELAQRRYQGFFQHYIEGKAVEDVASRLGIDVRTFYRDQEVGLRAILQDLEHSQKATLLATPSKSNLPVPLTPLLGRTEEVVAVQLLLGQLEVRLVTLTGAGGVGKTRVALAATAALAPAFAHGTVFVDLAPVADPSFVGFAIARALKVQESGNQPLLDTLKAFCRDKQLLLLLDNFEHLLEAAPLVTDLLRAAPQLKALVTSRAALQVQGEQEYPLEPLALPDLQHLPPLEALERYAAVALFVQRAAAIRPSFTLTAATGAVVAEICARLDGVPLAIELAAARSRHLVPQVLLRRLERRLPLLVNGPQDLPVRQQTLRATLTWSYDLLAPAERALFQRLGVFAGGCSLEGAEAVAGPEVDVLTGVERLLSWSLLRQEEQLDGEARLLMLETIREYAREQLDSSAEAAVVRERHAAYYLMLAEQAEPELRGGAQQAIWLRRLDADRDNLRAVLDYGLTTKWGKAIAVRMAAALWRFWQIRGRLTEGRLWLAQALNYDPNEVSPERARALYGAGALAHYQADYTIAVQYFEQSQALFSKLQDELGIADAVHHLGLAAWRQGDNQRAKELQEASLQTYRRFGAKQKLAAALNNLGLVFAHLGDYARARSYYEESLALQEALGHQSGIALALHNLGELAMLDGDTARAIELHHRSLHTRHQLGDARNVASSLIELGKVASRQEKWTEAVTYFSESLSILQNIDDKVHIIECFEGIAAAISYQGEIDRAAYLVGAAQQLRNTLGLPLPPTTRSAYDQVVTAIRRQLGETLFTQALVNGKMLPLHQTIAYALSCTC